jgi:hypothetical protein
MFPREPIDDGPSVLEIPFVLVAVEFPKTKLFEVMVIVVSHLQPTLVFGYDPILKAVTGVPRVKVHFADGSRVVSGVCEKLRPRLNPDLVIVPTDSMEIVGDAVFDRVHSGEQGSPRRDAYGRGGIGSVVSSPVVSDPIYVWSVDEVRAVATQKIRTKLIGENEHDVGAVGHWKLLMSDRL